MYGLGSRGGTPAGRLGGTFPEDAAEPREEAADEGMLEATVETETAAAAVGTPIDTVLRPMARLLTGQRPEGAETVAGPTEETWGPPSDTWAAAATEEEEGTDEDGTEEGKEEECRLESPSTLGCNRLELDVLTDDGPRLFCCEGTELLC